MRKTLFVVSDIHGYFTVFSRALLQAGFDPDNDEHLLVFCGDMFDKGPNNADVFNFLRSVRNKVTIRGNHEDALLDILETKKVVEPFYLKGTPDTVRAFFGNDAIDEDGNVHMDGNECLCRLLASYIGSMPNYFETKNYLFVHGWLPYEEGVAGHLILPDWRDAGEEAWKKARWTKWIDVYGTCDRVEGKTIVCGHYPVFLAPENEYRASPFYGDGFIAIDAGTFTTGTINVLVLEDELLTD